MVPRDESQQPVERPDRPEQSGTGDDAATGSEGSGPRVGFGEESKARQRTAGRTGVNRLLSWWGVPWRKWFTRKS